MLDVVDLEKVRRNALKAIREGRVAVRAVAYSDGIRAVTAAALVRGYTGQHQVTYMSDQWRCTCAATPGCPHVLAVQLVTGHAGATEPAPNTLAVDSVAGDHRERRHGIVASFCADCTGRDGGQAELEKQQAELLGRRGWTRAAFGGKCALCGEPYTAGEPIRATTRADQQAGTVWAGSCCQEALQ